MGRKEGRGKKRGEGKRGEGEREGEQKGDPVCVFKFSSELKLIKVKN